MKYIEINPYDGWYEHTIEDFCDNALPHFGLDVSYRDVAFSGFWSQGDGASFTGLFYLSDVNAESLKQALPTEVELHQLVDELAELAESHPEIQGSVTRLPSRYSHSNTMGIGEYSSGNSYCDEETLSFESAKAAPTLIRIFRELADWLYNRLNAEYDFALADATAQAWAAAIEERTALQGELNQLQADIAANPPHSPIQTAALTNAISAFEVEIEILTSKIDQLADQFHYWPKDGPFTVEQFYENYC